MHVLIANRIFLFLNQHTPLNEVEQSKLKYVLEVLIGDGMKILLILSIAAVLGQLTSFSYALLALMLLRPFTGGFHLKGFWSCFIFSFSFLTGSVLLNLAFMPGLTVQLPVGLALLIIVYLGAPIIPKERPRYSPHKLRRFKRNALIVLSLHLSGLVFFPNMPYFKQAFWVIVLQCLQLLFVKGLEFYYVGKIKTC